MTVAFGYVRKHFPFSFLNRCILKYGSNDMMSGETRREYDRKEGREKGGRGGGQRRKPDTLARNKTKQTEKKKG